MPPPGPLQLPGEAAAPPDPPNCRLRRAPEAPVGGSRGGDGPAGEPRRSEGWQRPGEAQEVA
eukprot:13883063-Alexandrium_andersonii.AAC.1